MATDDTTQLKDPVQATIQKNPCERCRKMSKPKCSCAGGGGGGAGAGDSSAEDSLKKPVSDTLDTLIGNELKFTNFSLSDLFRGTQLIDKIEFDIGLFKLIFNLSLLTLTFQGKPYLSQREQDDLHEFFEAVTEEFDLFKDELQKQGISVDNLSAKRINNELTFKFPNTELFNQFVQRLMDRNYLPRNLDNPKQEQAESFADSSNTRSSLPNPFSMVPRPSKQPITK